MTANSSDATKQLICTVGNTKFVKLISLVWKEGYLHFNKYSYKKIVTTRLWSFNLFTVKQKLYLTINKSYAKKLSIMSKLFYRLFHRQPRGGEHKKEKKSLKEKIIQNFFLC